MCFFFGECKRKHPPAFLDLESEISENLEHLEEKLHSKIRSNIPVHRSKVEVEEMTEAGQAAPQVVRNLPAPC